METVPVSGGFPLTGPDRMFDADWSSEDEIKLRPFFTNLDRDIFGLRLPQEVAGALFSRYSRSSKSLRRTFLDEFLGHPDLRLDTSAGVPGTESGQEAALKKAREFYDRVLVGYGDDSVAQLGGAHLACENISNLAANILEDARIGIAPLEKSTRYVRFDRKDARGEYPYFREPRIMDSSMAGAYCERMDDLFGVYSRLMEPVLESVRERLPVESSEFKHPKTGEPLTYAEAAGDPDLKRWADTAYRSTLRAQACDLLRGLLPMATRTNVGFFGIGQAFEYWVSKCYSHPLSEMRGLGEAMHRELNVLIPSFVKRAAPNDYLSDIMEAPRELARTVETGAADGETGAVRLVDHDPDAEEKVLAAVLFGGSGRPLADLREKVRAWPESRRREALDRYLGGRRHRRDKPGRPLENAVYTFEILCNIGIYRDLHRHRILTQERQAFTVDHGYEVPPEIRETKWGPVFSEALEKTADLFRRLERDWPAEAQYAVPFAYRVRWYVTLNLRELYHIVELRTMPQGHPDYRRVAQEMMLRIQSVHPLLAEYAKFVDWNTYSLGRLQSEMRTEYKRTILSDGKAPV